MENEKPQTTTPDVIEFEWIKDIKDLKEIQESMEIRKKVFCEEQNVAAELLADDFNFKSHHVIMRKNKVAVGTARLKEDGGQYFIGHVAILREYRRNGSGQLLVKEVLRYAKEIGITEVNCHSQTYVQRFYEKLGFEAYGEKFYEANIEHINMKIIL